jgi:prepilin-type N-terminal cleavage/methylation domain-containing protein
MKLNRTTRKDARAFTLIEVLLAVGIFAIVLFAINTVFFSALKLERATSRIVDARAPLNQAFAILRHDLQGAVQPMTNSTLLPRNFTTGGRSGPLASSATTRRGAICKKYVTNSSRRQIALRARDRIWFASSRGMFSLRPLPRKMSNS